jgi:hypothetical protein
MNGGSGQTWRSLPRSGSAAPHGQFTKLHFVCSLPRSTLPWVAFTAAVNSRSSLPRDTLFPSSILQGALMG